MERVALVGVNYFKCGGCDAPVRMPVTMEAMATIRAYGSASARALCARGCTIELTLRRPLQPYERANLSAFRAVQQ